MPPTSKFCEACGNGLVATAVVCPSCGTPTRGYGRSSRGKDKTVALLLAIFLGGWAWVYLYEKCKKKFWYFIGSYFASIVFIIVGFVVVFGSVQGHCNFNQRCSVHPGAGIVLFVILFGASWLVAVGMHIYAIVDVATKNAEWYESF